MKFDVAIVGSGLAGLSVALHLAHTRQVVVISKRALRDGASDWAQGGIAAVLDSHDSHDQHVSDTLVAGAGLCDETATRYIVEQGREAIEWLIAQGVPFTRDEQTELGFHLTREGGHSQRRIIHAADATGHAVQLTLEEQVRKHPNITLLEHHFAIDLVTTDKLGLTESPPRCLELGIDITKQPIPIVPATHYTCGGIVTDLAGRTDLQGLYAVGETAYTGLHGANRLASNSLLECVVLGRAAAMHIANQAYVAPLSLPAWDESRVTNADEEVVITQNWDELRRFMWSFVGIVRTTKRLERAQHRIALLKEEIDEYYANFRITRDLLELRNLVEVASLIVGSALSRRESRGLHYSLDYPETLPKALPTVLTPTRRSAVRAYVSREH